MKRIKNILSGICLLALLGIVLLGAITKAQTQNDDFIDAIENQDRQGLEDVQDSLEFVQFNSCASMESVLWNFLEQFEEADRYGPYRYLGIEEDMVMMAEPEAAMDMAKSSVPTVAWSAADGVSNETIQSSHSDYSTTNNQKAQVDEPEIIKTNGDEIFYYNRQEQKIYIIESPLDKATSTINLSDTKILTEVNLPQRLYNPQLFVTEDRLVVLASRNVNLARRDWVLDRWSRTSVAIYDISNPSDVHLLKFTDLDGRYNNSRMIDNKLYVLSQLDINRWNLKNQDTKFDNNLLPRALDIDVNNRALNVIIPECDKISYLLPSQDTIKETNLYPVFTIISVIDIEDVSSDTATNVVLANAGEIHMTTNSLYIAQNLWFPNRFACPFGARCIWPSRDNGQHSLIHKFSVDDFVLKYSTSNMVPGSLLTQYSMDEDTDGNFRILTRKNWSDGTNFFSFDDHLSLKGSIQAIQPGEQFKSSRYIGDKLYLVTFEQTDPLFVIDIADIANPEIIGELMIPGFSTYLHPMWTNQDGVQYLIWLWYGADDNGRQEGLQLSLYEVDYNQPETSDSRCGWLAETNFSDQYQDCLETADPENIRVSQLDSVTLGGRGSQSEAMQNPRMFVMDADNVVTLPMLLQDEERTGERCNVYRDVNGVEVTTNCYPVTKQVTEFAWLKSFAFDIGSGITEKSSIDYFDLFNELYGHDSWEEGYYYSNIDYRRIQDTAMRVWFAGDALYMINNDFSHFSLPDQNQEKYIYFDWKINK
jgi:uncharacterized secreted protein with C-terminal beta-propeller domain